VWVIYPPRQQVCIYRPGRPVDVLDADGVLDGEEVLPGFRLPLAEIWSE
jgi:Uma2 family endonuclease